MNSTVSNNTTRCFPESVITVVIPFLYRILFLVALVLNSLAAWVFFHIPTDSTFVVYLKNLVVADILMTLTIPVRVLYFAGVDPLDLFVVLCRYSYMVFYLSMYTSITFLGLISLDRFLKIVWPFREFAVQKVRVGWVLSAAVWLVLSSLATANIILANKPPPLLMVRGEMQCDSLRSGHGLIVYKATLGICQVVFWCVLVLMVVCYSFISVTVYKSWKASRSSSSGEASRKTNANVFVVVGVFLVCFAPLHFYIAYMLPRNYRNIFSRSCGEKLPIFNTQYSIGWLAASNACLDPLIYVFLCKKFRMRLVTMLTCKPLPP